MSFIELAKQDEPISLHPDCQTCSSCSSASLTEIRVAHFYQDRMGGAYQQHLCGWSRAPRSRLALPLAGRLWQRWAASGRPQRPQERLPAAPGPAAAAAAAAAAAEGAGAAAGAGAGAEGAGAAVPGRCGWHPWWPPRSCCASLPAHPPNISVLCQSFNARWCCSNLKMSVLLCLRGTHLFV